MPSRRVVTHEEIDRRLRPSAAQPDRFEELAEELIRELDAINADLEIRDTASWRRPRGERSGASDPFRAEVETILTMDRDDESDLARRIEFARMRLEREQQGSGLEDQDLLEILSKRSPNLQAGIPRNLLRRTEELHALRTEMVERNLYLVLINVERYTQTGASRVDLIQEGNASLFRAVDGFDWRRGLLFRTYAVHWLNQAFRNYLYNFGSTVRVPVYLQKALKHINQAQIRLGDPNASVSEIAETAELNEGLVASAMAAARSTYSIDSSPGEEQDGNRLRDLLAEEEAAGNGLYVPEMEEISLRDGLMQAMEKLSERERLVVCMRFGIGMDREHTLAEVAGELGVSVERVRQIQVRAISKMNTPNLRRDLDPFLN